MSYGGIEMIIQRKHAPNVESIEMTVRVLCLFTRIGALKLPFLFQCVLLFLPLGTRLHLIS